jgi:cellulose biosynthesis protein BcsQ
MALVIAVVTLKGAVGKTTNSIALAEAAAPWAPATVVDTDPLGSAVRWSRLAKAAGRPLRCTVVGYCRGDLPRRLGSVAHGAAVVVIDGPPPAAGSIARAAIEAADLVVMPAPPEMAALDRIAATRVVAAGEQKPAGAVLTMMRPRGGWTASPLWLLSTRGACRCMTPSSPSPVRCSVATVSRQLACWRGTASAC